MKKKKIYISGPISGLGRDEFMARFATIEQALQVRGYDVLNPTRLAPCRWLWIYRLMGYRLTLLYDLLFMIRCDGVVLLPGWKFSHGARIESFVARELGIPLNQKAVAPRHFRDIRNIMSMKFGAHYNQ